jgi:hypothetical protein
VQLKGGIPGWVKKSIEKKGYTGNTASNTQVRRWLKGKFAESAAADYEEETGNDSSYPGFEAWKEDED